MNWRLLLGYLLAFLIGALCRLTEIPLPAPTALLGAGIVLSITLGYLSADRWLQPATDTQSGTADD